MLQAVNILCAILGAGIAGMALARVPRGPARAPLFAAVAAGICWAAGDLIADGATHTASKQLGVSLLYTGSIAIPALWWMIAVRWSEEVGARLPLTHPAWQWAPLAWAGLMWLAMISNPLHGAFLTPVVGGRNVYHALWFAMAIPSYALILAALAVEVEVARRVTRREVRHQAAFLIAASGVSLLGNWLYVTSWVPVNLTVVVLSVSMSLLLVGMAREGLFGVLPSALSALAAEHPDGVVVVGPSGFIDYANPRARELLAPVVLSPERPLLEILQDPQLRSETDLGNDAARSWSAMEGPTGLLFQLRTPKRRWLQAVARPIPNDRAGTGRLLLLSDVTRRREIEQHRLQNRRLDSVAALASNVSSDFQSAFAIVRANAEILASTADGSAGQRAVARILEAADAGADLAHELQMHAGQHYSMRVTVDLAEAVDESCALMEVDLPSRTVLFHRRADEMIAIDADPLQLRDMLFALIANAAEAIGEAGGRIEVATGIQRMDPSRQPDLVWGKDAPPGEYGFVRVIDDGRGMDPETEERAFEPFFSTRAKDRGSGLSTVIGIARAHGALVGLENDPGWGCTFSVYLPLARRA